MRAGGKRPVRPLADGRMTDPLKAWERERLIRAQKLSDGMFERALKVCGGL